MEEEIDYSETIFNMEAKLEGLLAELNTSRNELENLDKVLDPFKNMDYAINRFTEKILKSPLYPDYVTFAKQWIPQKQSELEKIKLSKIKTAQKVLTPIDINIEKQWQENDHFQKHPELWHNESGESINSPYNSLLFKLILIDNPAFQGQVFNAWQTCEHYPTCKPAQKAWLAINDVAKSQKYCIFTPETSTQKSCDFDDPAKAFVRDRQNNIRDVKTALKENVTDLINERIDLNKALKETRSKARIAGSESLEKEKTDFSLWAKHHIKSENTKQYAHVLRNVVDTPEIHQKMFQRNQNYLEKLADSAMSMLQQQPSALQEAEYKAWEKQLQLSEARFGVQYVDIAEKDGVKTYDIKREAINHHAEWNTKWALNNFLQKSVLKIATVLDNRPDCNSFTAHLEPASLTEYNGIIKTECEDTDQFTAKNTLIFVTQYYKPSINNMVRSYTKYPTIFTDITHKKTKSPTQSEEWMNTVFIQK